MAQLASMSHMFCVTDDGCANGKETQMEESLDAFLLCRLLELSGRDKGNTADLESVTSHLCATARTLSLPLKETKTKYNVCVIL